MQFETANRANYAKTAERQSLPRRLVSTKQSEGGSFRLSSEAMRRMEAKAGPNRRVHCQFTPNRSSALQSGKRENGIKRSRDRCLCPGLTGY